MNSMQQLFEHSLKDLYNAEKQLAKALPKMAKMAQNERLKEAFERHLEETNAQIARLEEVCREMKIKPAGVTCQAMQGLIEEAAEEMKGAKPSPVMDCFLIGAAQKNEHYEIASYGTLLELAKAMGLGEVVRALKPTMDEEKRTDELLTEIAEREVNPLAFETGVVESTGSRSNGKSKADEKKAGDKSPRSKVSVR